MAAGQDRLRAARSEVLDVRVVVPADGAAEREFGSVGRVLDFERAASLAGAPGQLRDFVAADIVAVALPFVARFAEVGVAPAEPLRDRAAELALELDEVRPVLLALAGAEAELRGRALAADEVLRLEILLLLLRGDAIFHTAEVGLMALEALVVGQFEKCPGLQIVIVRVVGVSEARIFVDGFVLGALDAHLVDLALHLEQLLQLGVKLDVVVLDDDLLLAGRAV